MTALRLRSGQAMTAGPPAGAHRVRGRRGGPPRRLVAVSAAGAELLLLAGARPAGPSMPSRSVPDPTSFIEPLYPAFLAACMTIVWRRPCAAVRAGAGRGDRRTGDVLAGLAACRQPRGGPLRGAALRARSLLRQAGNVVHRVAVTAAAVPVGVGTLHGGAGAAGRGGRRPAGPAWCCSPVRPSCRPLAALLLILAVRHGRLALASAVTAALVCPAVGRAVAGRRTARQCRRAPARTSTYRPRSTRWAWCPGTIRICSCALPVPHRRDACARPAPAETRRPRIAF